MLSKIRAGKFGFTGFELLIVIALIGLLAWLVVSRFSDLATEARNTERRLDLTIIAAELETFYRLNGNNYPASASALPSYSQFINSGQPQPDTIAFLDPDGNFIIDSPSASTNLPATGYDPTQKPKEGQYTYAAYNCQTDTDEEATDKTESNDDAAEPTDDETEQDDPANEEANVNFSDCQGYVLYAWMEDELVYGKASPN